MQNIWKRCSLSSTGDGTSLSQINKAGKKKEKKKKTPILVASVKVKEENYKTMRGGNVPTCQSRVTRSVEYENQVHDGILMLIITNTYFKLNISRQSKFCGYSSSHCFLGCFCAKG